MSLSTISVMLWWSGVHVALAQDVEGIGQQTPFKISGSMNVGGQFFDAQGRPSNREPFTWYFQGNPVISIYGITFPFSFSLSEQQRDFRQPFNQFGVSPYYKWIKAHVGYRNITFSPFTLGGHTMAGGGIELTPGKLRFGFMYGRLLRAVQAVGNPDGTFVTTPSFSRRAASLKIGYGTEENFMDIILLKGQDDKNSIDYTTIDTGITPAENLVVGFYSKQRFLKNFFFEGEYAQSLFTRDMDLQEPDTLGEGSLTKPLSFLVENKNASTSHSTAVETSLGYQRENYELKLKYREVGPDYQSMGAYFFQNDLRNITIEPSVRFFQSALQISGSYGYQTDNLDDRRASTTKRKIGSVNLNGRIGQKYTGNIFYSNYDIGQAAGAVQLDTLIQVSQTVQNWGMLHNLLLAGEKLMHTITVNYNYQTLSDRNPNTAMFTNYNTDTWLGSYFLTITAAQLSFSVSYTLTNFQLPAQATKISGPTLSLSKTALKSKVNINLMYSSLAYSIDGNDNRTINRMSLNTTYRVSRRHRINLRFYVNQSAKEAENVQSFRELKGDVVYAFTF